MSRLTKISNNYYLVNIFSLILLFCILISCEKENKPEKLVLASFESEKELDELIWECGRWFELTQLHATHGRFSLKVEITTSKEPIFRVFLSENDWSSYNRFCMDVFNPEQKKISLTIRFIDKDSNDNTGKFYTKVCTVFPGLNYISIPITEIKQGPEKRNLKLQKMSKIAFLLKNSKQKHMLYFDNISLAK